MRYLMLCLYVLSFQVVIYSQSYIPTGYNLVWNEEFSGASLNTSKWEYRYEGTGAVNYTIGDSTVKTFVNNRNAVSMNGAGQLVLRQFISNDTVYTPEIGTQPFYSFKYGYVEARIKVQKYGGKIGAVWAQSPFVGAIIGDPATSGVEIDNMEYFGANDFGSGIHWDGYGTDHKTTYQHFTFTNWSSAYHTYGMLWDSTKIVFYYDGVEKSRITANISKQKEYLVLSIGTSAWNAVDLLPAQMPDTMLVDYVRVYQTSSDAPASLPAPENVSYVTGDLNAVSGHVWNLEATGGYSNAPQVVSGSLSYAGYAASEGNKIQISAPPASAKYMYTETKVGNVAPGQAVYTSFLLNLIDTVGLSSSTTGEAFISMEPKNWQGYLVARKGTSGNTYNLGIRAPNTTGFTWNTSNLNPGTTYYVVMGYSAAAGTILPDTVRLWVNPPTSVFPPYLPAHAQQTGTSGAGVIDTITRILIRQTNTSYGASPNAYLDGIQVSAGSYPSNPPPASPLSSDQFDYAVGNLTSNSFGQWATFTGSTPRVQIADTGLVYPTYSGGGIGRKVKLATGAGEVVYSPALKTYAGEKLYTSFLFNLIDTVGLRDNSFATAEGFMMFDTVSGAWPGYVVARKGTASNTFQLGLRPGGATTYSWYTTNLNVGTTYLVTTEYSIVSGSGGDTMRLWINPDLTGAKTTAQLTYRGTGTSTAPDSIYRIIFRQASAGYGTTPNCYIDGLRLSKSWGDASTSLKLTAAPQGYYDENTDGLRARDTFKVVLHNGISPYAAVDSATAIIDSVNLQGTFTFNKMPTGTYYIAVKGRNIVESWSENGGTAFQKGLTINYDMTSANTKVYGANCVLSGSRYCLFSGDVNRDGYVDPLDLSLVDQDSFNYKAGTGVATDINGDQYVDPLDLSIVDQNSFNYVGIKTPLAARHKRAEK